MWMKPRAKGPVGSFRRFSAGAESRRIDTDDFGRTLAVCTARRWEINKAMAETGWATAFRRYTDAYVADETSARTAGFGIWSSEFEAAVAYRHSHEPPQTLAAPRPRPSRLRSAPSAPSAGCVIKGNHSRKGEWIYHLPGMPY